MSQPLTEGELEQLLKDVQFADRLCKGHRDPMTPRIIRLLDEARELRDQQAEREFHYHEEAES